MTGHLPGEWKLADHPDHGRVLVVRIFRDKAIYATPAEALGIHTHVALVSNLTFLDTDNQTMGEGMTTRVIRTREELAALDPDTVLGVWHPDLDGGCILMPAREWADEPSVTPLSVIAAGDQVRAARQALKEGA